MPYSRLFYHFVWTTKHRIPCILQSNRTAIYDAISREVDKLNGIVHALNGMEDHVHLLATIPPTITLAFLMKQVKGASSYRASHLYPNSEPFAWQAEYGVLTVSESHLPEVSNYIQNQQQHHANQTLRDKLERID